MNSRFLMVLHVFLVLFMCLSPFQLVASNHQFGNVSIKCIERERQALLTLKRGFLLNRKDWLSSWGSGENEKECCNWERVQCSSKTGHVLKLHLHAEIEEPDYLCDGKTINSSAFLSPSLAELHHLKYLDLSYNSFYLNPYIPNFIGSLAHLRYLNLSYCCFEGKIPNELGNLIFLEYLDLGWNNLNGTISPQLANLLSLKYLDLSINDFTGTIPHHLGNLSNLQHLDLSWSGSLRSDLRWVSHLSSLRHLAFHDVNLSSASNWHRLVSGLSRLQHLELSSCDLFDSIPSSLSFVANFSTSLSFVDLSDNNLMNASLIFPWLINSTSSLATLNLDDNGLSGTIPEAIGNFSSLKQLGLARNLLEGQISLFHICSLIDLDLSKNRLTGQFHEFVQALSRCAHKPIQHLNLWSNEITGTVPDLSQLSSLEDLDLANNELNGTINEGIGQLSNLVSLSLRNNSLQGTISEAHFSRLSKLETLDLSYNPLVFNISTEWIPPVNLSDISLASCSLGPHFPSWLQNHKEFLYLDISSAGISDTVPNWFWNLSLKSTNLDLSHNHLRGEIPNFPLVGLSQLTTYRMDLSSNLFQGAIPAFLSKMITILDLSNNLFSTANRFLCANMNYDLTFLDLSNNNLKGELPNCWTNFKLLQFLDLSNNSFYGNLPKSLGSLVEIQALHLGSNNFSGEIPLSMNNYKWLKIFEAGQNNLSGPLPIWIGDKLPNLLVLSLRSNKFHGSIPFSICHLVKLLLLDLSLNNISGNLPKCIYNLSMMANQTNSKVAIYYFLGSYTRLVQAGDYYVDSASLIWKGKMSKYRSTLGLLRSIDFSSNRLSGEIPGELMSLVGLVSLNISRNMLRGEIPSTIGQLKSLDYLDLSRNHLFGRIPSQLAQLGGLGVLDLSYNDLSGEIPQDTPLQSRDASTYIGNPKLCGAPLNETCPIYAHQIDQNDANDDQFFNMGFYIAMAIGFIVGFWGVCFSLIFKKSWRYAYFKFLSDAYDKLYVFVAIKMAKLQRIRS